MKANTINHAERNVLQKMFAGYELFFWGTKSKTVHLSKITRGEFGVTGETVKKKLFSSLVEQGFITKSQFTAGRTFYVLSEQAKKLCK